MEAVAATNRAVKKRRRPKAGWKRRGLGRALIVMGVALALVWVVSGWFDIYRMWNVPGGAWLAGMRFGGVEVNFYAHDLKEGIVFEPRAGVFRNGWFRYATAKNSLGTTERWMYAPLWPVAVWSAACGVGLLRWGMYAKLRRRGRCAYCGYDLRGIGEAARCPECGEGEEAGEGGKIANGQ